MHAGYFARTTGAPPSHACCGCYRSSSLYTTTFTSPSGDECCAKTYVPEGDTLYNSTSGMRAFQVLAVPC